MHFKAAIRLGDAHKLPSSSLASRRNFRLLCWNARTCRVRIEGVRPIRSNLTPRVNSLLLTNRDHGKGRREVVHTAIAQLRVTLMVGNEPKSMRVEMNKLLATIALLCLSSTVLAHDIYSNLRDRAGHLCCNGQDCKPVQATVLPDGNYYLPASDEIIPAEMATPSPDDRFHHCIYYPITNQFDPNGPVWVNKPKTRCFFAPLHSS
jgi:hypothetical protein